MNVRPNGPSIGAATIDLPSATSASWIACLVVSTIACGGPSARLELLGQCPGLSNSDLARGAFVSRQSMNVLLQALERDGFVTRPDEAPVGKVLPTRLTPAGRRTLATATVAVRSVEERMLAGLSTDDRAAARRVLSNLVDSLG